MTTVEVKSVTEASKVFKKNLKTKFSTYLKGETTYRQEVKLYGADSSWSAEVYLYSECTLSKEKSSLSVTYTEWLPDSYQRQGMVYYFNTSCQKSIERILTQIEIDASEELPF